MLVFAREVRTAPRARQRSDAFCPLARTRVQQFFVFCLHLFTSLPQLLVLQRFEGEGF